MAHSLIAQMAFSLRTPVAYPANVSMANTLIMLFAGLLWSRQGAKRAGVTATDMTIDTAADAGAVDVTMTSE